MNPPTFVPLVTKLPDDLNVESTARQWFSRFKDGIESSDLDAIMSLFLPDAHWRDLLVLTWDIRTFTPATKIRVFLNDRLAQTGMIRLELKAPIALQRPYPDVAWILAVFEFETNVGKGTGVFRLVPTGTGDWRACTMFTTLDALNDHPEKIGIHRSVDMQHGATWTQSRQTELKFDSCDPEVIIVGSGHSGLELAARLKYLGVSTLVIEKNQHIGDNWRKRYGALCLHWPIWFDHMAYLPFPPTWPKYTPSHKMADWLDFYAKCLEINVWTSTTVTDAKEDLDSGKWSVTVNQANGTKRTLSVDHLVFATGTGDGSAHIPAIPEMESFKGKSLHATQFKSGSDFHGQKVIVVGSATSAHDVAADLANHDIDVTMFQRSSNFVMDLDKNWNLVGEALYSESAPVPNELADKLFASMPQLVLENGLAQRQTEAIMKSDKDLLEGLQRVGFKLNKGLKDAGFLLGLKSRGGGHYFNVGASDLIISGKIKLKNSSPIRKFSPDGLEFEDGSILPADVVIFATGAGNLSDPIRSICGKEIAEKCAPIWGLDNEGEINGCWRHIGVNNLWYMTGSFQMVRFHSKLVALQIKAIQAGVFTTRYPRT
ncbi:hypothetical protein DFH09DRAFT_1199203 [Mycena vulgaris]|nr:hypothetical protein DFH09DRAFT_1231915 [Mycena vulgaris]KAJ6509141.1 hypothetical protein DFH09DRAFT_1199203 [Mycena vulgaris]